MCNVLNCTIFSINRMSFAENHSLMCSTKSQYLETFRVLLQIYIYFCKNIWILGKHFFETNYNKNSFQNTPNQSLFKNALREQYLYYLKFPGPILSKYQHAPK